ncbi:MAG: amino acid adenylation protein [Alteromonadaceae bacterium]|nr:MAG: amino acid adenylation protein [Alteromonadaceae bacterium]
MTILEKLYTHAQERPNATAFRFLTEVHDDGDSLTDSLSYKELWQSVCQVANFLRSKAEPGSCILLFYPPGLAYIKAFYGCLLAGMIAVPLYPPRRNANSDRVLKVAQSCQSSMAMTEQSEIANVQACWQQQNSANLVMNFLLIEDVPNIAVHMQPNEAINPALPAFLQYTSGSTGSPKGVMVTHENIVGNVQHLSRTSNTGSRDDVFVNWLPLFHDMGLVVTVLWPVYLGATSVLMAPATFVQNPQTWLKAISRYRGTICGAPNFAYDLCAKKIPQELLPELDLSTWRIAFCAAEPVRSDTLKNFYDYFGTAKFNWEALNPSYGMAEATVFISGAKSESKPKILTLDKAELGQNKFVVCGDSANSSTPGSANNLTTELVGCGQVPAPHSVKIVDPKTKSVLPDGAIGEIWFSGPSVSPGYWKLPEVSAETFNQMLDGEAKYLRTGDLGALWQGEVFVTGRMKDLIIINGVNYYPQDIENTAVMAHPALRDGACAAFTLESHGLDALVVVAEVERQHFRSVDKAALIRAIRQSVMQEHSVNVDHVVLLKPHKIPLTSSGKIQRKQTAILLSQGELDILAQADAQPLQDYIAPRTEVELAISAIWAAALKVDRVSVAAEFSDVGGDSITAIEIAAKVKSQFALADMTVEQIIAFSTIEKMSEFVALYLARRAKKTQVNDTKTHSAPRKRLTI